MKRLLLTFALFWSSVAWGQVEVRRYNTLTELLSANPSGFSVAGRATVIVTGNTNLLDGTSRILAYSASDTGAVDNVTIFAPVNTNFPGRYRLLKPGFGFSDLTNAIAGGTNVTLTYATGPDRVVVNTTLAPSFLFRVEDLPYTNVNFVETTTIDPTVALGTNVELNVKDYSLGLHKLAYINPESLIGFGQGVNPEEFRRISLGSGLAWSGDTIIATGGGFDFSALTNALIAGANITFDISTNTLTINATGGGGGTNGTAVTVDGGADLTRANFADSSEVTFSISGTNVTAGIPNDSIALGTKTSGNFVAGVVGTANEVTVSGGSGSEASTATLSLPATLDLGGKTSLEIPNGASPTTDAFGEIAGDNDAWGSGRGAVQFFDGTANTLLVGVLASDTPVNGQVPVWNTGGTITWETPTGGGGTNGTAVTVDGGLDQARVNFSDSSEVTFTLTGTNVTAGIPNDSIALGTKTSGNFVAGVVGTANEVTVTGGSGSEASTATLSLPATIDLGGKTSFEIPNGASPTTDAFGEIAGDNNAWASGRGAVQFFDGTANTLLVGVLASDTPVNGQVPVWNTGGTITWETATGGGGIDTTTNYTWTGTNTFLGPVYLDTLYVTNLLAENLQVPFTNAIVYANGSSNLAAVTIGSGLSFSGGTLSATGGSGSSTNLLVNGLLVTQANLTNSANILWEVTGSNIRAVPTNITGSGSVSVNGNPVSTPNFQDSADAEFNVTGSNITITVNGAAGGSTSNVLQRTGYAEFTVVDSGAFYDMTLDLVEGCVTNITMLAGDSDWPGVFKVELTPRANTNYLIVLVPPNFDIKLQGNEYRATPIMGTITNTGFQFNTYSSSANACPIGNGWRMWIMEPVTVGASTNSGGGDAQTWKYLTVDQATTNTTPQNITNMVFSIGANEVWTAEWYLGVTVSAPTGMGFALDVPTGATLGATVRGSAANATVITEDATLSAAVMTSASGAVWGSALVQNGTNAGSVQLQFGSHTNTVTSTIKGNRSYMVARKISP